MKVLSNKVNDGWQRVICRWYDNITQYTAKTK